MKMLQWGVHALACVGGHMCVHVYASDGRPGTRLYSLEFQSLCFELSFFNLVLQFQDISVLRLFYREPSRWQHESMHCLKRCRSHRQSWVQSLQPCKIEYSALDHMFPGWIVTRFYGTWACDMLFESTGRKFWFFYFFCALNRKSMKEVIFYL